MSKTDNIFLPKIEKNKIEDISNFNKDNIIDIKDSVDSIDIKHNNINNINNSIFSNPVNDYINKNNEQEKLLQEYKNKIDQLELTILNMKNNHLQETSKLISDNKLKEKNIKLISNINKNLNESLNSIKPKLNEMLVKFYCNNKKISKQKSTQELNFEEQLILKEKELKNQQQLISILSLDNKNLKNSMDKYNYIELNRSLNDKLLVKEKEITKLNKVIKEYKNKFECHTKCEREIESLKEKINNNQKEISEQRVKLHNKEKDITELQTKFYNSEKAVQQLNLNIKERFKKINNNKNTRNNKNNKNNSNDNIRIKNNLSPINHKSKLYINSVYNNICTNNNTNNDKNNLCILFNEKEIETIKKMYEKDSGKFEEFIKKVDIIQKYKNSKEKALMLKIKQSEMKIKEYEEKIFLAENSIKDKERQIF